jgi:hypothetical protein
MTKSKPLFHKKAIILFFICSFISCRSTPKQFDALLQDTHIPLDTGASVYILANVKQSRSIINILPIEELQDSQTQQMLSRTNFVAAALFPPESGRRFQLAAWGKYPNSRASMALGANRHWEKQTNSAGRTYWYAQAARLSLAMTSRQAFALSSLVRQPIDPQAEPPGVQIPEGFNEFAHGVPLACWINNAGPMLSEMMSNAGIPLRFPVQKLYINIYPMPGGEYEALIRMIFANQTQARGAATILNLASGLAPADFELASVFLANSPVHSGSNVDIKTERLSESDLQKLLSMILN